MVEKVHFFDIVDPAILVAELVDVGFEFKFRGGDFFFAIRLVHFRDYFALLLNGPNCPVTAAAPGLGPNVLHKGVWTGLAFL